MSLGASPSLPTDKPTGSSLARGLTGVGVTLLRRGAGEIGRGNPWPLSGLKGDLYVFIHLYLCIYTKETCSITRKDQCLGWINQKPSVFRLEGTWRMPVNMSATVLHVADKHNDRLSQECRLLLRERRVRIRTCTSSVSKRCPKWQAKSFCCCAEGRVWVEEAFAYSSHGILSGNT